MTVNAHGDVAAPRAPSGVWFRLVAALITTVLALGAVVGLAAGAAAAQEQDVAEGVQGTIQYRGEDGQVPIEGAVITVTDEGSGEVVGGATTDSEGRWLVEVPGPGTYTVALDPNSLPEGVTPQTEEDVERAGVTVNPAQVRPIIFPVTSDAAVEAPPTASTASGNRFLQLFAEGIRFGLLLALMAIGLSLIFGTTGLVNFAHGEMVTFGALVAFYFNVITGLDFFISAILATIIGGIVAGLLDLGIFRPLRRMGASLIAQLVVTIGISLLARYLMLYFFRGDFRAYAQYAVQEGVNVGIARLAPKDLWSMGIAIVVLIGIGLLLQRTRIGKAMRAVSDNRDLAESTGIDVQRVILLVWVTGGSLAALAGLLWGLSESVSWIFGFRLLLLIFAGVILGGLGTAYGALVGSLVVGVFIQVSTLIVPTELKNVGAMVVLILILVFRPQGILGRAERVG